MDYYASYKNSKDPLVVKKRVGQLRTKVRQQKSCTAVSSHGKNGQKAQDFLKKAHQYQNHFNFTRFNTYKNASPVQLLQQAAPLINRAVLNFKLVLVDHS